MTNLIKKYYILIAFLFYSLIGYSQADRELLRVEYSYNPLKAVTNDIGETFDAFENKFQAKLNFPIFVKNNFAILNNLNFINTNINTDNTNTDYPYIEHISGLSYGITTLRKFDKVTGLLSAEISYASNSLTDFKFNQPIYRGAFVLAKQFESNKIKLLGAGIAIKSNYGAPTVLPILIANIKINNKLQFDAKLPMKCSFSYKLFKKTEIGIRQTFNIDAYLLGDQYRTDSVYFVKLRNVNLGLFLEHQIHNSFYFSIESGTVTKSSERIYNKNAENIDNLNSSFNYYIKAAIFFKLNRNE